MSMHEVQAPAGYEGSVYYVDGARAWQASFREIGATWWTNAPGLFGHAHLTQAEVVDRAAAIIERAISDRRAWASGGRR